MDLSNTTELWFWFGFGGMSLGSLIICLLAAKMKPAHRYHAILAVAVTSIATIAYYALARGQATATIGGGSVFFGRYADWLFTTPLLLVSLLVIALPAKSTDENSREKAGLIGGVVLADVLMIVTGFFADLSSNNFDKVVWYVASCLWFALLVLVMYTVVQRRANAVSPETGKVYGQLLSYLSLVWIWYPIVWAFGSTGYQLISDTTETALYAVLDVSAKAVFGIMTLVLVTQLKNSHARSAHRS